MIEVQGVGGILILSVVSYDRTVAYSKEFSTQCDILLPLSILPFP